MSILTIMFSVSPLSRAVTNTSPLIPARIGSGRDCVVGTQEYAEPGDAGNAPCGFEFESDIVSFLSLVAMRRLRSAPDLDC